MGCTLVFGDQDCNWQTHPARWTYAFGIDYCYQFFRCCDSITSTSPELIFKCSMYFGPAHVHRFAMFWRCGPSCCWLRPTHGICTGRVANLLWSVILRSPGPEATLCWCHCWRGFQHAAMCWTAWTNARRLASQFRFWNCKRTARNAKCGWYLDFSKLSWHQEEDRLYSVFISPVLFRRSCNKWFGFRIRPPCSLRWVHVSGKGEGQKTPKTNKETVETIGIKWWQSIIVQSGLDCRAAQ